MYFPLWGYTSLVDIECNLSHPLHPWLDDTFQRDKGQYIPSTSKLPSLRKHLELVSKIAQKNSSCLPAGHAVHPSSPVPPSVSRYVPLGQFALHVAFVRPVVVPYVPLAHWPEQNDAVRPAVAPYLPCGHL